MIIINNNKNSITINGHANFAKKGHDIVCAAISAIVFGAINSLESIDENEIKIKKSNILIKKNKMSNKDKIKLNMMMSQIQTVAVNYPKNIKIIRS